jgi:hypothetical protein
MFNCPRVLHDWKYRDANPKPKYYGAVSLNKDDKEDEDKKPLKNTPKKNEPKEAMGASSAGGYSQPLFGTVKRKIVNEFNGDIALEYIYLFYLSKNKFLLCVT